MQVGKYTYGHEGIFVDNFGGQGTELYIGKFCSIASNVKILLGGEHEVTFASTYPFGIRGKETFTQKALPGVSKTKGDVVIGNDVWIGNGVTILSGVTIADGAVIASNSHVHKNIGPYEIWGGNPAKLIKKRFSDKLINQLLELKWWDLPEDKIKSIVKYLNVPLTDEIMKKILKEI